MGFFKRLIEFYRGVYSQNCTLVNDEENTESAIDEKVDEKVDEKADEKH